MPTFTQPMHPARRISPLGYTLVGVGCLLVLIVWGVLGYLVVNQFAMTATPTLLAVASGTPTISSSTPTLFTATRVIHTPTMSAATPGLIESPTRVSMPTSAPTTRASISPALGSATPAQTRAPLTSLRVSRAAAASGGIRVNVRLADGSAAKGIYVAIHSQKQDISGNPIAGDRVEYNRTGDTGSITFNLKPATYTVEIADIGGYVFGEKFNYQVSDRTITVLDVTLGRLRVGLKDADGKPLSGRYAAVSLQKTDISGNPVRGDRVAYDRTDNTGIIGFDITAGYYLMDIGDIAGYPWGEPYNWAVRAGETTSIILGLGRIRVGIKDAEGKGLGGKYVAVHFQKKDVDNNPILGDRITYERTDNTGSISFDLTAGAYAVQIGDLAGASWGESLNRVVQSSNTTSIVLSLGRLSVGLKGTDGKPLTGRYVALFHQKKDVAGNVIKGYQIVSDRTGTTGLLTWDLTAGNYVLEIEGFSPQLNVPVQSGKTTTNDGTRSTLR
jgi:hypothetical protein